MRKMLNTLYVTTEDAYLTLDSENVAVQKKGELMARFPLHSLEAIIMFTYAGASPALMGACAARGVCMSFLTPSGRFLARSVGESNGNVLLRTSQYRTADDDAKSLAIARNMIFAKVYNSRWVLERMLRDHGMRLDKPLLENASGLLKAALGRIREAYDLDSLRGMEGDAASTYFSVFDELILNNKQEFAFSSRSRRPPLNRCNALLSFAYTLLANDCAGALETVGLDSYVGFLHRNRPGRASLALDIMEELRPCYVDRFVVTLINNRIIQPEDFTIRESGAVLLTDDGRKKFLKAWQERKRCRLTHPYLKEKLAWGLLPHIQAKLLSRYLRGDLDEYPPFLWK